MGRDEDDDDESVSSHASSESSDSYREDQAIDRAPSALDGKQKKSVDVYAPIVLQKSSSSDAVPSAKRAVTYSIPAPDASMQAKSYVQMVSNAFVQPAAYVHVHRADVQAEGMVPEYELTVEDDVWLSKHAKLGLTETTMENIINALEFTTGFSAPATVAQALPALDRFGVAASKQAIDEVAQYWLNKRNRLRKPLLRRFWPVTGSDDTNPLLTFRPREKERYQLRKKRVNDPESFEKMQRLLGDFELVRDLVELVWRREKMFRLETDLMQAEYLERLALLDPSQQAAGPRPRPACLDQPLAELLQVELDAVEDMDQSVRSTPPPDYHRRFTSDRKRHRASAPSSESAAQPHRKRDAIVAGESYEDDSAPAVPLYLAEGFVAPPVVDLVELVCHYPPPFAVARPVLVSASNPSTSSSLPSAMSATSRHWRHPLKLVCRPRVGRLGRVMVDRALVSSTADQLACANAERYAGPHPRLAGNDFAHPSVTPAWRDEDDDDVPSANAALQQRLAQIFAEPDSEDDEIEPVARRIVMNEARRAQGRLDKFVVHL